MRSLTMLGAGLATTLALLGTAPPATNAAGPEVADPRLEPVATLGGPGHAGLYGWGAATMRDGTVLVGDYWNRRVLRFAADGTPLGPFIDDAGFQPDQHQSPYGLAVDPSNGDVYMADTDRRQVDRYDESGRFLNSFGRNGVSGDAPDLFKYPSRVAVRDGHVFVADTWLHRISVWTPTGTSQEWEYRAFGSKPGHFKQPRAMVFDADGLLHVVDAGNKQVDVFEVDDAAETLRFVRSYGAPYVPGGESAGAVIHGDMRGLAIDAERGWVYVVDGEGNRVHKFSTDGDHLLSWGGVDTFSDGGREATVDHAGNVWVGDMPGFRVQVFSPTGERLFTYPDPAQPPPPGGFNGPRGVAVDPRNGDLFVSDTYNFRIQKLAADGTPLAQWGSRGRSDYEFNYTRLLAVDPRDGSVVVADTDNHRVKKYDAGGTFLWELGSGGNGPGQFKNPHGVDIGPDGTVYVADTQNSRVQVLTEDGAFVRSFGSAGTGDGQLRRPRGIVADDETGEVYVADALRDDVQVFTPDGAWVRTIGKEGGHRMGSPFDVEVDATHVYVADPPHNTVAVWRKDGTFVDEFGGGGTALGKLRQPQGLDLVGDVLYVAEQANERVSTWRVARGEVVVDTTPPASELTTPVRGEVLAGPPATLEGTAADDTSVAAVQVAVKDRSGNLWWNAAAGEWRTKLTWNPAVLADPGAPTSAWSFELDDGTDPGSGGYWGQHRAIDAAGNIGTVTGVRFDMR
jgi:tripartite motif-containing protein 71